MSLKYSILGFLTMMPLSGYDLKKMYDSTINYFWSADHSQIYRLLDKILKEGLVTKEIIQQSDFPNKKVYHLTEKGFEELRRWLKTPHCIPVIRHNLLLQLTWADQQLSDEEIITLLLEYKKKVKDILNIYKTQNQAILEEYARTKREKFLWESTLLNGVMYYETELKWLDKTIKDLKGKKYLKY